MLHIPWLRVNGKNGLEITIYETSVINDQKKPHTTRVIYLAKAFKAHGFIQNWHIKEKNDYFHGSNFLGHATRIKTTNTGQAF